MDESGCPPWTYRPNSTSPCQCGSSLHGAIECNITSGELLLQTQECLCVTYDPTTNESVAGQCLYSCIAYLGGLVHWHRHPLPMTRDNFTDLTCGVWKREGPLCSQCIPGYGIPLHSYDLKCVQCSSGFQVKDLFKFLAVLLIPPTVLCIVATVLRLNVLRPPWSVFVFAAQTMSTPLVLQALTNALNVLDPSELGRIGLMCMASIYGLWNLDFLLFLYNPTCISPTITATQSYFIEVAIGVYPLVLLVVMYAFVTLRDRGCRVIVKIWKPFHFLISRFQSKLNIKTSLIDTFATFLLLSYMKIGFTAYYLLTPTALYSPDGSHRLVLYWDPSVEYFGPSHIGYAVITLLLVFVVLIIPIIFLFLYPFQWFQKCLNHFHLQLLPLRAFVDAFQGCYKDGTDGTRDCRCFAALQFVLRLIFPFIFFITTKITLSLLFSAAVLGFYIILFVIVQPYKVRVHNKTDVVLLMTLLFTDFISYSTVVAFNVVALYIFVPCAAVPVLYLVIWSAVHIKHIITHRTWCRQHTEESNQLLPHIEYN